MSRFAFALTLLALVAACDPGEVDREVTPQEGVTPAAEPAVAAADELLARYVGTAAAGEFAPKDECLNMAGAPEFRRALAQAVVDRDADALVALADPAIHLDFGGGYGHATLRARLTDPQYALWDELEKLLPLGCAAGEDGNSLTMPHYFDQDIGQRDPYATLIAIGADVPLYEGPDAEGRRIGNIGWQAVESMMYSDEEFAAYAEAPLVPVRLADGTQGFAARSSLRSLIDYRASATRGDDGWRLTTLIAGD